MGKSWTTRRRGDEKDLGRWLRKGKTVYIVQTPNYAGRSALWNHPRFWTAHTVTGQHPLLGGWVFDKSPTTTVESLFVEGGGTIYDTPPAGIPHASDPGPDCRDEGLYGIGRGQEFKGTFGSQNDGVEEMERLGAEAAARAKADKKSGARKGWW
ncbi:hypothetical protein GT352_28135 [Streptomyces sp. SID1046]|uniref:hypothetical protein n=1 Tax=Streptomyces sp. SID1046 TaxID=2690249 RepID=UPI0013695791|nr:hypothetical protein [Streptomyces sp. SID1046]MYV77771.1 hypothetical protein [Streptomyces sp. SID1046]